MNKLSIAAALAALALFGTAVHAQQTPAGLATLVKTNGKVMVDKGAGYVVVTGTTALVEGDRVITLAGSAAEITFADGCKSQLKENNAMVISAADGCKAAITQVTPADPAASNAGTPLSQIIGPIVAAGVVIGVISEWDSDAPISAQ
jgi:hypothetical protein